MDYYGNPMMSQYGQQYGGPAGFGMMPPGMYGQFPPLPPGSQSMYGMGLPPQFMYG